MSNFSVDDMNGDYWGAVLLRDSYKGVLAIAKAKKPIVNDWAEDDGLEVLEDVVRFEKKEVTLHFAVDVGRVDDFLEGFKKAEYREFLLHELNLWFTMRFVKELKREVLKQKVVVSLGFVQDEPNVIDLKDKVLSIKTNPIGYAFNGVGLEAFGVVSVDKLRVGLEAFGEMKQGAFTESNFRNGASYYGRIRRQKSRTVSPEFVLRCADWEAFCGAYFGFLGCVTQSTNGVLTDVVNDFYYYFYYDGMDIVELDSQKGDVWCKFRINLIIYNDMNADIKFLKEKIATLESAKALSDRKIATLESALNGKANTIHSHNIKDIEDLKETLEGTFSFEYKAWNHWELFVKTSTRFVYAKGATSQGDIVLPSTLNVPLGHTIRVLTDNANSYFAVRLRDDNDKIVTDRENLVHGIDWVIFKERGLCELIHIGDRKWLVHWVYTVD